MEDDCLGNTSNELETFIWRFDDLISNITAYSERSADALKILDLKWKLVELRRETRKVRDEWLGELAYIPSSPVSSEFNLTPNTPSDIAWTLDP
jgi:hypothetical protein